MKLKQIFVGALVAMSSMVSTFAQTADEIVAKHITAIGGADKWKAIKAIEITNKTNSSGTDVNIVTTTVQGDAQKMVISVMGMEMIASTTKEFGWMNRPAMMGGTGEPEDMPASLVAAAKDKLDGRGYGAAVLMFKEKEGGKAELMGEEKVNGKEAYKIKLTDKAGVSSTAYISKDKFYLLRYASKIEMMGNPIDADIVFGDFRQVEGLTFPFNTEMPDPRSGGTQIIETETIKLNGTYGAEVFAKPKK
jgi:hypothetical protein